MVIAINKINAINEYGLACSGLSFFLIQCFPTSLIVSGGQPPRIKDKLSSSTAKHQEYPPPTSLGSGEGCPLPVKRAVVE